MFNDILKELLAEAESSGSTPFKAPADQNTSSAQPKDHFTLPKGITFDASKKLSQREASNLVQQAQDKAEEVDTIAFGLELNDGEIVKVYVATEDAEAFEKAMSELLGKEDDIETAINDLAGEYDIVSVEWPNDDMTGDGTPSEVGDAADDMASGEEGDGNVDDLADKKEKKTKLGFDLNKSKEEDEADADKADSEEAGEEDKKPSDEDEAGFDDLGFGGSEGDKEKGDEEEGDSAVDDDEEEEDEEGLVPPTDGDKKAPAKKKKKKPAAPKAEKKELKDSIEDERLWPFSSFLNYLSEEKPSQPLRGDGRKETTKEDEAEEKIEDIFKTAMQRKIIRLIILIGMPATRLAQGKSLLRHGVREAALGLINNPKGRLFLNRTIKEFEDILGTGEVEKSEKALAKHKENVKEGVEHHVGQGTNKMFDHILELLESLGVPHDLLHTRKSMIRQALKPTIARLIKHGKLRNYVANLGKALGHEHHTADEEEPTTDEEVLVKEAADLGDDAYVQLVAALAGGLGIPDENLNYKKSNVIQSLRKRKQELNLSAVRQRAVALAKVLSQSTTGVAESLNEEAYRHMREKAVDLGAWSVSRTGERSRLAIDSLEIKLDSTETKQLLHAVDNGFETTVRSGNEHFNFKPIDHGISYVVIPIDSDNEFHEGGIKFGQKSVEAFLNLW